MSTAGKIFISNWEKKKWRKENMRPLYHHHHHSHNKYQNNRSKKIQSPLPKNNVSVELNWIEQQQRKQEMKWISFFNRGKKWMDGWMDGWIGWRLEAPCGTQRVGHAVDPCRLANTPKWHAASWSWLGESTDRSIDPSAHTFHIPTYARTRS